MSRYDPDRHHRRSIRLKEYDYTQAGAYFVTICAYQWECLFGDVRDGEMVLSEYGRIVQETWDDLPNHYPHVELDAWVVMPNHVHGIIVLAPDVDVVGAGPVVGAGLRPAPTAGKPSPRRHDLLKSCGPSNRFRPVASINCAIALASRFGNATTTSMSSGLNVPSRLSVSTS